MLNACIFACFDSLPVRFALPLTTTLPREPNKGNGEYDPHFAIAIAFGAFSQRLAFCFLRVHAHARVCVQRFRSCASSTQKDDNRSRVRASRLSTSKQAPKVNYETGLLFGSDLGYMELCARLRPGTCHSPLLRTLGVRFLPCVSSLNENENENETGSGTWGLEMEITKSAVLGVGSL